MIVEKKLTCTETEDNWYANIVCIVWMWSFLRSKAILNNVVYALIRSLDDEVILILLKAQTNIDNRV